MNYKYCITCITTWPSLAESLYNFCSTLVAFRSFILCLLDGYNKALCNDELYLVKGGPASGLIILTCIIYYINTMYLYVCKLWRIKM